MNSTKKPPNFDVLNHPHLTVVKHPEDLERDRRQNEKRRSTQKSEGPHPLRPTDTNDAIVWDAAASVPDPEIPVISIADLGILRNAEILDGIAVVTITPTYSGCPAMDHITVDVEKALANAGFEQALVKLVLEPAWSTDWMTETGRQQLLDYGIAPPQTRTAGKVMLTLQRPVDCPRCGSIHTTKINQFGSTSCKALYVCGECNEPFDYFKAH